MAPASRGPAFSVLTVMQPAVMLWILQHLFCSGVEGKSLPSVSNSSQIIANVELSSPHGCPKILSNPAHLLGSQRYVLQRFTPNILCSSFKKLQRLTNSSKRAEDFPGCSRDVLQALSLMDGDQTVRCSYRLTCQVDRQRYPPVLYQAVKTPPPSRTQECNAGRQCRPVVRKLLVLKRDVSAHAWKSRCPTWRRTDEFVITRYSCRW